MATTLTQTFNATSLHDGPSKHAGVTYKHVNGQTPAPNTPANDLRAAPVGITTLPAHAPKGKPVEDDFMYELEGHANLPTVDYLGKTVGDEDPRAVATEWLESLSKACADSDGDAFADLFWDEGVWRDKVVFTFEYRTFNGQGKIRQAAKVSAVLADNPILI